ncbi:MAG TPA: serine/threonine-protein kinase [Verrucomicrobiae bacterium]|nr:serine/threonine-protein kinase [Verrucomicrobiae bacterium]
MQEPLEPARDAEAVSPKTSQLPAVPDHQMVRLIGSGSGGDVWLAKNALGTYRAVKIVQERSFKQRRPFEREFNGVLKFEPVSRLHDGLVNVLQVGHNEAAGYFYCVMELADDIATGQLIIPECYYPRTLEYDFRQRGRLPIGECVRLGAAIASALGFLHRHGLIHRDIKPSNIIFVNGFPKLADMGLVTESSETTMRVGTEGFMPPEGAGTAQADIYSLGKVLYEISTGLDRNDYPSLPTPLADTPEDRDMLSLNRIVLNACRGDTSRRYQTAEELLAALLSLQFSHYNPGRERFNLRLIKIIGIIGAIVGFTVVIAAVWRLLWLLEHGP